MGSLWQKAEFIASPMKKGYTKRKEQKKGKLL